MYGLTKWLGGLVCLTSILSRAAAQNDGIIREITTTTAGGWIQDGVMFDVEVGTSAVVSEDMPDGITIMGMNILTQKEDTVCVEIYSKSGSHEGFERDPLAWTFLGSVSVMGQGKDTLTPIPLGSFDFGDETFVPIGEKRSFYVTTQDQAMRYTAYPDGPYTTGSMFTSQTVPVGATSVERSVDPALNVSIYTGVANDYPFGPKWINRMFNGNLLYTLGRDTSNVPIDLAAAKAASRGKLTCDKTAAPTAAPTLSKAPTETPTVAPTLSKAPTETPTTQDSTLKALATILAGGFLQAGNMLDVSVPSVEEGGPKGGITVLALEISTFATDDICVEVYSKAGTHVGFQENASAWTMLGATTTTGQGANEATRIPLGSLDPVHIAPGERRAFYIVMEEEKMRYTQPVRGEVTGDVFVSNDEIQIHVGSVNAFDFGGWQSDRIWNGAVIYSLGLQEDGKYSKLTADDRPRSCIVRDAEDTPTEIDTGDAADANAGTDTDVDTDTGATTDVDADSATDADSTTDADNDIDSPDATAANAGTEEVPVLSGKCGAADQTSEVASKDVEVNYKYAIITDAETIADGVVSKMEEEIHDVMMIDKCASDGRKWRSLQEAYPINFIGFNSAPKDIVTSEGCPDTITIPEGGVCSVVQGGVTAVVPDDTNETEVKQSLSTDLQQVLSNDAIATDVGALGVAYIPSDQEGTEDQAPGPVVGVAEGQSDTPEGEPLLSTTQIIIIASVCGGVLLITLLGMVLVRRRRGKRADEKALFNEFPSEHGYGDIQNLALGKSDDPLDDVPTHSNSWGSSGGAAQFAWHDSARLQDRSKYAPSSLFPPPNSGSKSRSKKNVEFVRAGRSFASTRSDQPDDTVDL